MKGLHRSGGKALNPCVASNGVESTRQCGEMSNQMREKEWFFRGFSHQ